LPDVGPNYASHANKKPRISGAFVERLKGLEPSTFCMASGKAAILSVTFCLQIAGISVVAALAGCRTDARKLGTFRGDFRNQSGTKSTPVGVADLGCFISLAYESMAISL